MTNPQFFFNELISNNIDFFTGVPDSLLKDICAYITDNATKKNHIIAANEGNALALGIGYHLATGKLPLIYMQNSGLGNIVNPLLSLADAEVYSVPMLLMIGWRGEPNFKDEPQHKKQGRVMLAMLEAMEVPYKIISKDNTDKQISHIIGQAKLDAVKNNAPYALVIKKNTFTHYQLKQDIVVNLPLFREDAIKIIVNHLDDKVIVVATTGVASRELFEHRKQLNQGHQRDFLTVGGMGHASQIALGIAMQKPSRQVFCFDGDGAMLMHMGAMAINGDMNANNFKHIVFNNGAHDSVGGQATVCHKIDLLNIAKSMGYSLVMQAKTEYEIIKSVKILQDFKGTAFLEIKVKKGFRKNLGRPTTTPIENKQNLMKFIQGENY